MHFFRASSKHDRIRFNSEHPEFRRLCDLYIALIVKAQRIARRCGYGHPSLGDLEDKIDEARKKVCRYGKTSRAVT